MSRPTTVVPHIPYNEVSVENFTGLYSSILEKVSQSKYVAFDTEFTGHCQRIAKNMEQRYDALAAVIRTHAILSFGMTTIDELKKDQYNAHNFEFLASNQNTFQVNPSNMKFLAENGLDLNRHFSVGLPYCAGSQPISSDRNLRSLWRDILVTMRKQQIAIVVHNGLLDLMYLYQSFVAELPSNLQTFVADLVEMFPGGIYDTKYLAVDLLSEQKTYLAYLYCKYDRARKEKEIFAINVQDPLIPTAEVSFDKRKIDDESTTEENALSKSHKRHLILDEDQGIKREEETAEKESAVEDSQSATYLVEKPASEEEDPKQRRDHAAHFDAYMTAFVFCHIMSEVGESKVQSHINKLNLMRLHIPLRIVKSQYAKSSPGWIEVRKALDA
ncbi:Target of EGR1, member 1 (Nuclear) [Apophysomyces sp. BC1015]|nr:Target of EGR1, member 1 (Nuclear) [Apophysomyces sp. BC1015]